MTSATWGMALAVGTTSWEVAVVEVGLVLLFTGAELESMVLVLVVACDRKNEGLRNLKCMVKVECFEKSFWDAWNERDTIPRGNALTGLSDSDML